MGHLSLTPARVVVQLQKLSVLYKNMVEIAVFPFKIVQNWGFNMISPEIGFDIIYKLSLKTKQWISTTKLPVLTLQVEMSTDRTETRDWDSDT